MNAIARIFTSPLARRLAKDAGLDLSALTGTGPHGRIVERDVKAALAGGARKTPAAEARPAAPLAEAPPAGATRKFYEIDSYE
ncbi:E3 binding domain-containing protein, partial [Escherichia coli]|uniref:E3 binding domain-containing protein n=1 Tax=Escherichia coli TaxID=562 RepID=UPI00307958B2